MMKTALVLIAALLIGGCAVVEKVENSPTTLRIAVAEYINYDVEKADRVIKFARDMQAVLAEDNAIVYVVDVTDFLDERIPWTKLGPAERILAEDFVAYIESRMDLALEAGTIDGKTLMDLVSIMQLVERTAEREKRLAM